MTTDHSDHRLRTATWAASVMLAGIVLSGPVSLALVTAARPGWVMTPAGFVMFAGWNTLVAVMVLLAIVVLRRRFHVAPLEER